MILFTVLYAINININNNFFIYKQFIYSKQQHRQTPYKHKGSDAETRRWLTVDLRLVSNTSRALGEEAAGRGRSDFLFRAAS